MSELQGPPHWPGCWREHLECAVARAEKLEKAIREAEKLTHVERTTRPLLIAIRYALREALD